jgi:GcrA cell cycle regulator
MRKDTTTWPAERVAVLKSMWADGCSASVIAEELGVTRNAVIGKVYRLKLPVHAT